MLPVKDDEEQLSLLASDGMLVKRPLLVCERTRHALHNDHFDLAEDSCTFAAALASQYALDFLARTSASGRL